MPPAILNGMPFASRMLVASRRIRHWPRAALPVALWLGNLVAAAHHTRRLLDLSKKHRLLLFAAYGSQYQRVVDLEAGPGDLAHALVHTGRGVEELAMLDQGIDRSKIWW